MTNIEYRHPNDDPHVPPPVRIEHVEILPNVLVRRPDGAVLAGARRIRVVQVSADVSQILVHISLAGETRGRLND